MQAASWVLVSCLVLAGFGFLVTRGSGSSTSSSAASAASSQSASAPAGASVPQPAAGRASEAQPGNANDKPSASAPTGFLVYSTGTAYERSTLASQVRGQLGSHDFGSRSPATAHQLGQRHGARRSRLVGREHLRPRWQHSVARANGVRIEGHRRRRAEPGGPGQL